MQKRQAGRQRSCVDLLHQGAGSTEGGLCGHSGGVTGGVSGTCVCQQIPERDWQPDLEPALNRKENAKPQEIWVSESNTRERTVENDKSGVDLAISFSIQTC